MFVNILREGVSRGWDQPLLGGAQKQSKRQWAQTQEVLSECGRKLYCEGDRELAQIAQRVCGVLWRYSNPAWK